MTDKARGYYGCGFVTGDLVLWGGKKYLTGGFGACLDGDHFFYLLKEDGSLIHPDHEPPFVSHRELVFVKSQQDIEYDKLKDFAP
jgi:hypothetical protein